MELIQEDITQNDANKSKIIQEMKNMRTSTDQRFYDAIHLLNGIDRNQINALSDSEQSTSQLQYVCDVLAVVSRSRPNTKTVNLTWLTETIDTLKQLLPDAFNEEDHEFLAALLEKEEEMVRSTPGDFVRDLLMIALKFAHGLVDYTPVKLNIKSLLLKEKEIKSTLLVLGKTYSNTFDEIGRMEEKITSKEISFSRMNQEMNELEEKNTLLNTKLLKSRDFLTSIENDYRSWKSYLDGQQEIETRIIRETLIQSVFLVYCGGFDGLCRTKLMQHLFSLLNEEFDAALVQHCIESMVAKDTLNQWRIKGLLHQDFFIQNAVLIEQSIGVAFIIDPDGEGLRWLTASLDSPAVSVSNKSTEEFRSIVTAGELTQKATIIVLWQDDASPVIQKLFYDLANNGAEVPARSLYFVARWWSPVLSGPPCSLSQINFTLSEDLYEHVILDVLLTNLRDELSAQHKNALKSVLNLELQIEANFETLMTKFSQEESTLLEDSHLTSLIVKRNYALKNLESAHQNLTNTSLMLRNSSENLRLNSQRCSVFMATLFQMNKVNAGYSFCLQMLLKLIVKNDVVVKSQEEFTNHLYALLCNSLFIRDRALFGVLLSLQILISEGIIPPDTKIHVSAKPSRRKSSAGMRLPWVDLTRWNHLMEFVKANPHLESILDHIVEHSDEWQTWYNLEQPEKHFPSDLNFRYKKAAIFVRFITLKILRPDRIVQACTKFVEDTFGNHSKKSQDRDDLHFISTLINKHTPILLLGSQCFDPVQEIVTAANNQQIDCVQASVVFGEPVASRLLSSGTSVGSWVILEDAELDLDLAESIVLTVYDRRNHLHIDFRLWITMKQPIHNRRGLLNVMICLIFEKPSSFRMNVRRTFQSPQASLLASFEDTPQFSYKSIFLAIILLHSSLVTRQLCTGLPWSFNYPTDDSDFQIIAEITKSLFTSSLHENRTTGVLKNLKYSIEEILTGRVMESADTITLSVYIHHFVSSSFLQELMSDFGSNFQLNDMDFTSVQEYFNSISYDQELRFVSLNSIIPAQRLQLFSHEEFDEKLTMALRKQEREKQFLSGQDVMEKLNLIPTGNNLEKEKETGHHQHKGKSDLLALKFKYEYVRICQLVAWLKEQVMGLDPLCDHGEAYRSHPTSEQALRSAALTSSLAIFDSFQHLVGEGA
eukprot:758011-Hanusia_phi.AAC.3